MLTLEIILVLLAASAALEMVARKIHVPRPTLLVAGGVLLALIPGIPQIGLDPDLLFLLFIPPLLYWTAFNTSLRDLRTNFRAIGLLAIALVIVTMCGVAIVAHALIPNLPWSAAFVLGAIVSPPDAVAVSAITERLHLSRRITAILQGEGLLNDATALVAYRMAVAAVVSGVFSPKSAALQLIVAAAGGVAIGVAVGWLIIFVRSRIENFPLVENTVSLLTPFIAYIPAEHAGASGVLSVVTVGLYIARQGPRTISARTRLQAFSIWQMLAFIFEGLIFIITGLELRNVTTAVRLFGLEKTIAYGLIISATCIVIRLIWTFPSAYLPLIPLKKRRKKIDWPPWQGVAFVGWAGIRGADSLVIALALPLMTAAHHPFPKRHLIIFITFVVILVSLIVQGISLEPLIRLLRLPTDDASQAEEREARRLVAEAGVRGLEKIKSNDKLTRRIVKDLRERHSHRAHRYGESRDAEVAHDREEREEYRRLRRQMIDAERRELIRLRDHGKIGDDVLRRVQRDLDLEETLLDESSEVQALGGEAAEQTEP